MSVSALVQAAEGLSNPESPVQLAALDAALSDASAAECDAVCAQALLRIFERFPEAGGFGVFWSVVHFLESGADYEVGLVESVRRSPSEFGLTLITRMINSGLATVGSERLVPVSRETVLSGRRGGMADWRERLFSWMMRTAQPASDFFRIPSNRVIEIGTQIVI